MVLYERRDGQAKASFPAMIRNLAQFRRAMHQQTACFRQSTGRLFGQDATTGARAVGDRTRQFRSRVCVNRMWGHLFGRGMLEEPAVDDFNSDNKVVHPELLDYFAEEFKKYNYDPKKLLEWICTSDVYNLSHVANKMYADQKYDPYFARMPLKAMSPEVMFDSLSIATRAEAARTRMRTRTQERVESKTDSELR